MFAASKEFAGTARFELLRKLGEGGVGVVYEAFDRDREVRVALKHLRFWDADALLRFKQEFRQLQAIRHPNLVSLGELFEEHGQWFFTMELVEGIDLLQHVTLDGPKLDERSASPEEETVEVRPGADLRSDTRVVLTESIETDIDLAERTGSEEARLVAAMAQLARGLNALHEHGKVHRDIKPSNVLVTKEGRVVILDFGLVTDASKADAIARRDTIVGTIRYMAPEQALGGEVGPAADFYALGVVLYRALTGRFPIDGDQAEVIQRKQFIEPMPPSTLNPSVAPDLDTLAVELLSIEPERRPLGGEVLRRLRGAATSKPPRPRVVEDAPLLGRDHELAQLSEALTALDHGKPVVVYVHGESGLGKSTIVRKFADDAERDHGALVLRGRCYERESVPYKAFDGIIDALSLHLGKMKDSELREILPIGAALIPQLFPVLRRVDALAARSVSILPAGDSRDLRTRVFIALRALFRALAAQRPTVLVIDDLQWADRDSHALFSELFYVVDAPALLVVSTMRVSSELAPPSSDLARHEPPKALDVRNIHLEPLDLERSTALARALLERQGGNTALAAPIARDSKGHPMFIDELVRHAEVTERASGLDAALFSRIAGLELPTRQIVEALAVAGAPLTAQTVAQAVALDPAVFFALVDALRSENLVRTTGARRTDKVEFYHDRVRASVMTRLEPRALQAWHGRLALALEAHEPHAYERLAVHWQGAGQADRAADYAARAGRQAQEALAFEHAATLYRLALSLGTHSPEDLVQLRSRLGHVLSDAGRGPEAAQAFIDAARISTSSEKLQLERLAAEQLIMSGHLDRGLEVIRRVGHTADLHLPTSLAAKLASFVYHRARIRLRGVDFDPIPASDVPAAELERIDAGWSICRGLAMVDTIAGVEFQARHLLHALRVREPLRVLRVLGMEIVYAGSQGEGSNQRIQELFAIFDKHRTGWISAEPRIKALVPLTHGTVAHLQGRYPYAIDRLTHSERVLAEECTSVAWELSTCRAYIVGALFFLGRLRDLATNLKRYVADARSRGDRYALVHFHLGVVTPTWLALGEEVTASQAVAEASQYWPKDRVRMPYFYDAQSRVNLALFHGGAKEAFSIVEEAHAPMKRAFLFNVQYMKGCWLDLRGRAAVAIGASEAGHAGHLALARQCAADLAAEGSAWLRTLSHIVAAGAANVAGDVARARAELRHAIAVASTDSLQMELHAASAQHMLAKLTEGEEHRQLVAASDAYFEREGVVDRHRTARMMIPGFEASPRLAKD